MATIPDTEPIFAVIPDSPEERLDLVKQFALRWSGDPVVPPPGIDARIAAAEARLRIKLPLTLQLFYESGLRDWFAAHGHEARQRVWPTVEELGFHQRSGDLTYCDGVVINGIRPEHLNDPDPPVREAKYVGYTGGKPRDAHVIDTSISVSEVLIRDVLLTASDVAGDDRSTYFITADGVVADAIRSELALVPINGYRDGGQWIFYEGADLLYQEVERRRHPVLSGRIPGAVDGYKDKAFAAARAWLDWRRTERILVKGSETAIRQFLQQHPVEEICAIGYVFELCNYSPAFSLCGNTRRYQEETIARYRKEWSESEPIDDELRWNSGEYEFPADLCHGGEIGDAWETEYARLHVMAEELDDSGEDHFGVSTGLLEIGSRAMAELARRGLFGDWSKIDFNIS